MVNDACAVHGHALSVAMTVYVPGLDPDGGRGSMIAPHPLLLGANVAAPHGVCVAPAIQVSVMGSAGQAVEPGKLTVAVILVSNGPDVGDSCRTGAMIVNVAWALQSHARSS